MNNLLNNAASSFADIGQLVGSQNMTLGSLGLPDACAFSIAKIIAWIVFGGIGFIAFAYGKKQQSFKPLLAGIALMVYPYFFSGTFWLYAVGIALCAALYFWRD